MIRMSGRLLNLGTIDSCGRKFSEDCKISFPEKIPISINLSNDPKDIIGHGEIFRDDKGFNVLVSLYRDNFDDPEYNVGGFYTNVKSHDESSIKIIDECKLVGMGIVTAPADRSLKIRRMESDVCENAAVVHDLSNIRES